MLSPRRSILRKDEVRDKKLRYPFWFGGSSSCFAACVTHPLDLVKVCLQTRCSDAPQSMIRIFVNIIKNDSVSGLYRGLSASLLRQLTYSTTRFGMYEHLKSLSPGEKQNMPTLIAMASISGFVGGFAGNPADVSNVRMQHDAALPVDQRRNYKSAVDGIIKMTKQEGWHSLLRGVWPNSTRAVLMTASQLASYDGFKRALISHTTLEDNYTTHFSASLMAGFVATTVCNPLDVIKTRIMSAQESNGLANTIPGLFRLEGLGWAFRGWLPSFVRLGPHTIATFLFLEHHKKMYRTIKGIEEREPAAI